MSKLQTLIEFLSSIRLDAAQEKRAQQDLDEALEKAGWSYEREYRLSNKDIVDFYVDLDGQKVALELKTRAQRMRIFRQIERYAQHESVDVVILLTGTAMQLPATINHKPAYVVSLGAGWL